MNSTVAERTAFRKRVQMYSVNNKNAKKSEIVNHFTKEGTTRSTIYRILNKLNTSQPIKEGKRTGRPSTWTACRVKRLVKKAKNKVGTSSRKLAREFQVNHTTILGKLNKLNLNYRKRQKAPAYPPGQADRSKYRARKLVNSLYAENSSIIIDDEKYFEFDGENMPGNAGFYTDDIEQCPDDVRFKSVEKYPAKILVWIAISDKGMSEILIRKQGSVAIKSHIYIKECLEKRLLPFIHKYYPDFNYIFWPDLASAHYSKETVAWYNQNINYVPKNMNPPNVPQARPIENFWGCLAQKVYENGWKAQTEKQLIARINLKLKDFDISYLQKLMKGVKAKLRTIADEGVFQLLK